MLRRIRRQLDLIHYYSAPRTTSGWARAREWVLLAAIVLAPAMTVLGEGLSSRTATVREASGMLAGETAGPFVAYVVEAGRRFPWPEGSPYGEFLLKLDRIERGWPFPTSHDTPQPSLDLNVYDEVGVRRSVELERDSELRRAIALALDREPGHAEILAAWNAPSPPGRERYWPGSVAAVMVWWIVLSLLGILTVELARLGAAVHRVFALGRSTERLAAGQCSACGYDLRGLEFHDRCPECGTLLD